MSLVVYRDVPVEDRQQFLTCMVSVIRADGLLDASEIATLHEVLLAWDLGVAELERLHRSLREGPEVSVQSLPGFVHPKTAYILVRTLIRLSHEDGSYCEEEQALVQQYAKRYLVPPQRVAALEAFVQAEVSMARAGDALLEPVIQSAESGIHWQAAADA